MQANSELRQYLAILWRRKWVIAITAAMTLIVTAVGTFMATPIYVASTTLRITPTPNGPDERLGWGDIQYADRLMNTYLTIATSRPVMEKLGQALRFTEPAQIEELRKQIKVEIPANTELIQITAEDQDPMLAAEAANTLASILATDVIASNTVSVVEPAIAPENPSQPRKALNIALGLLVGLVGGMGLAFLFENLDTTLYTTKQIAQAAEAPILGQIPLARKQQQITCFNSNSPQEEAFRRLRTNLSMLNHATPLRTLLVTSAEPGEGKSTIVVNLAAALAKAGRRIIVVDGDMRLPTFHTIFDLPNQIGLSSVLKQRVALDTAVQASNIPGLHVLTSGPLPSNPAELLGSPHMIALIEQLTHWFDMVLLDTPSLLAVTDAAVLAPIVDSVVLVVGRDQARQEAVQAVYQQLLNVKAKSIGVVINRAEQNANYHYYQHILPQPDEPRRDTQRLRLEE
jgi:capsular exopolysaccharide synthesis family protein